MGLLTTHAAIVRPTSEAYDWEYVIWAIGAGTLR